MASRPAAFRAADSHLQNEAYLARLGEAMAQLERATYLENEKLADSASEPFETVPSFQDRASKLKLLKGKIKQSKSREEELPEGGAKSGLSNGGSHNEFGGSGAGLSADVRAPSRTLGVINAVPSRRRLKSGLEHGSSGTKSTKGLVSKASSANSTESSSRNPELKVGADKPKISRQPKSRSLSHCEGGGQGGQDAGFERRSRADSNEGFKTGLRGESDDGCKRGLRAESDEGFERGLRAELDGGFDRGLRAESDEEFERVLRTGLDEGFKRGLRAESDEGFERVLRTGLDEGFEQGLRAESDEGFEQGLRTGLDEIPSTSGESSGCERGARQRWEKAPVNEAGRVTRLSERPILCMSVLGSEAVVGSSDHALYAVDLDTGRKKRTLYGKTAGHTEWVTCVTHLPDGRILSGAMDSRLLLWAAAGACHSELVGHTGSISAVRSSSDGSLAISSSYDKTLRVWGLAKADARAAGRGRGSGSKGTATCLAGHVAPVLDFALASERVVSGARDGCVILWDLGAAAASRRLARAHVGHVTALAWLDACSGMDRTDRQTSLFLSGGQDGFVRVWDGRSDRPAAEVPAHVASSGTGAVSGIRVTADVIVTAGADGMVRMLDPRASFRARNSFDGPGNFIYALHVVDRTAFSGGGDGSVLVHDLTEGRTLYGLGAIKNGAVRCIETAGDELVCAGDDGTLITYSY